MPFSNPLTYILACYLFLSSMMIYADTSRGFITLSGSITHESYLLLKEVIEKHPEINEVVLSSEGGSMLTAIAIGKLIKSRGFNVRVVGMCLSACANYIFVAGNKKIIQQNAILGFHGGYQQEGLLEAALYTTVGQTTKTIGVSIYNDDKPPPDYILDALNMRLPDSRIVWFFQLVNLEKEYFSSMKVNNDLPTYGQKGIYRNICFSQKYKGFYYDIESLKKMGIENIEVEGGDWHPEVNRVYHDFYEVKFP